MRGGEAFSMVVKRRDEEARMGVGWGERDGGKKERVSGEDKR